VPAKIKRRGLFGHPSRLAASGFRQPQYLGECYELEQIIWQTLDRIRERDGAEIMTEVAERLTTYIRLGVEIADGKWDHLGRDT